MQKFNISKEKQQQEKLWTGIIKKDNKKEMYQAEQEMGIKTISSNGLAREEG